MLRNRVLTIGFSLGLLLAPGAGLAADTPEVVRVLPRNQAEMQLSFAPLVKQVAPAVVNIYTRRVVRQVARSPLFDDPFFQRFFGENGGMGLARQRIQQSLGSGVILDRDGLVVTNNHVIEGADQITVALADRREFTAKVVLADPRTDLAVLRIEATKTVFPTLQLRDSDSLEVGDLVLAIGDPFGVGQTVTSGIISGLGRTIGGNSDTQSFIQTDAAINPGNSGGALVTMDGRLAGINSMIVTRSGGSQGIGFAIPANLVANVLQAARAGHGLVRAWFGAGGQSVTAEMAAGLELDRPGGVLINSIYPGGPAARAGVKVGDVILAVDNRTVVDPRGLKFRIATETVGQTVTVDIVRKGDKKQLSVLLEAPPEVPKRDLTELTGDQPLQGATIGNLSPAFAEQLGMEPTATGVVITAVAAGSTADRLHFKSGDRIADINGTEVSAVDEVKQLVARAHRRWRIGLLRGDKRSNLIIE